MLLYKKNMFKVNFLLIPYSHVIQPTFLVSISNCVQCIIVIFKVQSSVNRHLVTQRRLYQSVYQYMSIHNHYDYGGSK